MIRKEISNQLSSLGLATKEDLARLEAKLSRAGAAKKAPPPPKKAPAKKAPAAKKAGAKKAAPPPAAAEAEPPDQAGAGDSPS